jgi:heavy metal sensor kinase
MITAFHTLRFRLALWYALVLALLLSAFGIMIYGIVRYQLTRHHDAALRESAAEVVRILSQREDCEHLTPSQKAELDRIGHLVLFHEVEGEGRVFYRSPDSSGLPVAMPQGAGAVLPTEGWFESVFAQSRLLRMYTEPYRSRAGRRGLIHVVQSLGDVVAPLASLRLALLLLAPLAILVSAAGGYWLGAWALAPVDRVTRMAREIEATKLGRRLPVPSAPDEIGRLVDTLNQMIARLEASFDAMKRFTADASHELRGPLATMRGAIDVALSRPREASEYRDVLASVGEDVDRLRSIAEDLLVLARADAGRIELERSPVRLDVLAAEIAESFQAVAMEHHVQLDARCEAPVPVLGDERWLRQLVVNLLDNAVKFSAAAGSGQHASSVTVETGTVDGAASLRVADSGPGIPEDDFGRIFERFYRADDARSYRPTEGAGLGLSIAAWIVNAHNGRITAENRPQGGSVFSVRLPLAPA